MTTFKEALKTYLKALEGRDIDTLLKFLPAEGGEVVLILPDGSMDKSRDKFVEGHIEWFKDDKWTQTGRVINTIESGEMAVATVKYVYDDGSGEVMDALLGMVFRKTDSGWLLVHDQNTPVKAG